MVILLRDIKCQVIDILNILPTFKPYICEKIIGISNLKEPFREKYF